MILLVAAIDSEVLLSDFDFGTLRLRCEIKSYLILNNILIRFFFGEQS